MYVGLRPVSVLTQSRDRRGTSGMSSREPQHPITAGQNDHRVDTNVFLIRHREGPAMTR